MNFKNLWLIVIVFMTIAINFVFFLHGGPGSAEWLLEREYNRVLEGATGRRKILFPENSYMHVDQFVS